MYTYVYVVVAGSKNPDRYKPPSRLIICYGVFRADMGFLMAVQETLTVASVSSFLFLGSL